MTKKSLRSWYNSNDINFSQREIIKKFGVGDYYPERERRDFLKLWYWDEILDRKNDFLFCWLKSYEFYNNLLIVVNDDNDVNLIVYEMPMQKSGNPARGNLKKFLAGSYVSSYNAINEARELENKLKYSNNPFLAGYPANSLGIVIHYERNYDSGLFPINFSESGMVEQNNLPYEARYNPDKYIKPIEIEFMLVFIMGDKHVCHAVAEGWDKKGKIKIDSWSNFLSIISTDKIIRYHPVVPFKKPEVIIRHIAKSVEGTSSYFVPALRIEAVSLTYQPTVEAKAIIAKTLLMYVCLALTFLS